MRATGQADTFEGLAFRLWPALLLAPALAACAFPDYAVQEDAASVLARICSDGEVSEVETGLDCGGGCAPCLPAQPCRRANDCLSLSCSAGQCQDVSCGDGLTNGSESDRDCGGQCPRRCEATQACRLAADCESGVCRDGVCQAPSCDDGVRGGDETGVDCGGGCPACEAGMSCRTESDCVTRQCVAAVCVLPACTDGLMNGNESSVDCGGPECAPCGAGDGCRDASDCSSLSCDEALECASSQCHDAIRNGAETDVDCGGGTCSGCGELRGCSSGADCASDACQSGRCVPAAPTGEEVSRQRWMGEASHSYFQDTPSDAFDGDPSTIWSTGTVQRPGMFFEVDLGAERAFYALELECSIASDLPASLDVYLWDSGAPPIRPVRTNVAGLRRTKIQFATPQVARHVRFVLGASKNAWWCIGEIRVVR